MVCKKYFHSSGEAPYEGEGEEDSDAVEQWFVPSRQVEEGEGERSDDDALDKVIDIVARDVEADTLSVVEGVAKQT